MVEGEDTRSSGQIRDRFDMVVLATGMVPNRIQMEPQPLVTLDEYGFMVNDDQTPGICGAGCARRPTEVASSVQDSTAAALRAIQSIARR